MTTLLGTRTLRIRFFLLAAGLSAPVHTNKNDKKKFLWPAGWCSAQKNWFEDGQKSNSTARPGDRERETNLAPQRSEKQDHH